MTSSTGAHVGVVFVNHLSEALIRPRSATMAAAGFAVTVVDNSGTYGVPDLGVVVVDPGANVGFAVACNRGVATFGDDVDTLVFHNPDADITAAEIEELVAELARQSRPGLVAPAEQQGELRRPEGYHYPSVLREVAFAVRVTVKGPSTEAPAAEMRGQASTSGRRFGSGALLVASRSMYESIGGFDERFFLYGEDLDLWHRAAQVSDVAFSGTVTVRHAGGQGSPTGAAARELLRWMGLELFEQLHGRSGGWRLYRLVHRQALRGLKANAPAWAADVAKAWHTRQTPEQVQVALRPTLELRR